MQQRLDKSLQKRYTNNFLTYFTNFEALIIYFLFIIDNKCDVASIIQDLAIIDIAGEGKQGENNEDHGIHERSEYNSSYKLYKAHIFYIDIALSMLQVLLSLQMITTPWRQFDAGWRNIHAIYSLMDVTLNFLLWLLLLYLSICVTGNKWVLPLNSFLEFYII